MKKKLVVKGVFVGCGKGFNTNGGGGEEWSVQWIEQACV